MNLYALLDDIQDRDIEAQILVYIDGKHYYIDKIRELPEKNIPADLVKYSEDSTSVIAIYVKEDYDY